MLGHIRAFGVYTVIVLFSIINYTVFKIIRAGKYIGLYDNNSATIYCNKFFFGVLATLMPLLFWIKINYKSESNKFRMDGRNIMVCNHVSYFDPFVIGYINYWYIDEYWKTRFVAYHKLFNIPIAGYVMRCTGAIPIVMADTPIEIDNKYNSESSKVAIDACENALKDGNSVFIFPEGKRNADPSKINKIKLGPFNLSKKTSCNIQILSLDGIDKIWSAKGKPDGMGTITVTKCGDPKIFDTPEEYRQTIEDKILTHLTK